MISQELLNILRCPLDPTHTRLKPQNDQLECERCAMRFQIKDGFPILVVEEAMLPTGCESVGHLPCQRDANPAPVDEVRQQKT